MIGISIREESMDVAALRLDVGTMWLGRISRRILVASAVFYRPSDAPFPKISHFSRLTDQRKGS